MPQSYPHLDRYRSRDRDAKKLATKNTKSHKTIQHKRGRDFAVGEKDTGAQLKPVLIWSCSLFCAFLCFYLAAAEAVVAIDLFSNHPQATRDSKKMWVRLRHLARLVGS